MKVLLVVYDNDSHISEFPLGLAYVASVIRKLGHEVHIYNQDIYHWPESHLKDYLDRTAFDIVGVSVIGGYYQYAKLLKISDAINQSKKRPFYILGGHGPAPEPEYFMEKTGADIIVIGEGELTIVEILESLENHRGFEHINGIAFSSAGKCVINPRRDLIQDIDEIDFPAWDLFPIDHYALLRFPNIANSERSLSVLSGRGCIFQCNFCYRMDRGFRPRSSKNILEEILILQKDYNISYIAFYDELLMSSAQRTIEFCETILSSEIKFKWSCNGRLNFAKPKVLDLMKRAGCVFINYGIESMDQSILNVMKKKLTIKMIYEGIDNTLKAGISPGYNIIFGNIGETIEALQKGVEFLLKYDDHSQRRTIRPVTPYPGSPLYYYAIEKGLLKDCANFYEEKHLNSDLLAVNFTDLSNEQFHEALYNANRRLLEAYYKHAFEQTDRTARSLYFDKDVNFRGFRHT